MLLLQLEGSHVIIYGVLELTAQVLASSSRVRSIHVIRFKLKDFGELNDGIIDPSNFLVSDASAKRKETRVSSVKV